MARANIICFLNNHGLGKDAAIIAELLTVHGHSVLKSNLVAPPLGLRIRRKLHHLVTRGPIYDVNIHVEHALPALFPLARRNILVPNLEALRPETAKYLERFDAIFCKTLQAHSVLGSRGLPVRMVGFTTTERRPTVVPARNWRGFLHASTTHAVGGLSVKGTEAVYRVWSRHPEWPMLEITGCDHRSRANITCHRDYVPEQDYAAMQLRNGIHLCPSEMEGFGHYIAEPMRDGCVVVTTDGTPMNELVSPGRGYLVTPWSSSPHMFGTRYQVDDRALERVISTILDTGIPELEAIGARARAWFRENDERFRSRFTREFNALLG